MKDNQCNSSLLTVDKVTVEANNNSLLLTSVIKLSEQKKEALEKINLGEYLQNLIPGTAVNSFTITDEKGEFSAIRIFLNKRCTDVDTTTKIAMVLNVFHTVLIANLWHQQNIALDLIGTLKGI